MAKAASTGTKTASAASKVLHSKTATADEKSVAASAMAQTKTKDVTSVSHEEATASMFRKDPQFAAEYLNQMLADGGGKELLFAIRHFAAAFGSARTTKLECAAA